MMKGKFGAELLQNERGEGVGRGYACINRELLFKHGNKAQPATSSFCSLKELTMGKPGHCVTGRAEKSAYIFGQKGFALITCAHA